MAEGFRRKQKELPMTNVKNWQANKQTSKQKNPEKNHSIELQAKI